MGRSTNSPWAQRGHHASHEGILSFIGNPLLRIKMLTRDTLGPTAILDCFQDGRREKRTKCLYSLLPFVMLIFGIVAENLY